MTKTKSARTLAPFLVPFIVLFIASPVLSDQGDLDRAWELNEKVAELYQQGRYAEAIPIAQEALAIREKLFGPEHPDTAQSLNNLAELFKETGDYAAAEPLSKRALAIWEKTLGLEHPDTAIGLSNLGSLYEAMGDYAAAEPLYQRSLAIREKVLGPEHPDTATCLNNLAWLNDSMGKYAAAEPLYLRSLAIREKVLGPDHPDTAVSLNNLGLLYEAMGEYAKAEPQFNRALAVWETALGPEHPATANCLNNLAVLYKKMGDYAGAEPLYERALAIREKALGPEHPRTAVSLNNLAVLYSEMGDFARAEPLYERALTIRERALGPEHPETANALNNLASLYRRMGDYARAEPLSERALAIDEKVLGPEHPGTAADLSDLALLYRAMGNYAAAEPLYKRSLAIRVKVLGPEHPETAAGLSSLASLYNSSGDYAAAEPLYKRALAISEKVLGPEHPDTAVSLNNLAWLYYSTGDYAQAEPLYRRTLAILKKTFGPDHLSVATNLNNLAALEAARGEYRSAHDLSVQAQTISTRLIERVMGLASEDRKMKFMATRQGELEMALGLVAFHLAEDKRAVREILDVWLTRKGIILEAQRRFQEALVYSDDPEAAEVIRDLALMRSRLSRLMFGGPGPEGPETYRRQISGLEARINELEAKLGRLSQSFARQKTMARADTEKVARALPQGAVLLDFAQIPPYNFQAKGKDNIWGPAHYLVFVLPAGQPDRVGLVDLGEAEPIDLAVADLKSTIADPRDSQGAQVEAAGERLYDLVFAKLEKELGPARDIFISPDGNLNLIPFEVLRRPDGKYLIEGYSFNYLASGRDLVGFGLVQGRTGPPLLMGDPDFSLDEGEKKSITRALGLNPDREVLTANRSSDLRGIGFSPLPGTGEEVKAIRGILGPEAEIFTGKQALEEVLAAKGASPRILHLATHGFFLTDQQFKALTGRPFLQFEEAPLSAEMRIANPLLRSGLALAGANRAFQSDETTGGDGLFTAEEVLGLRLHGTDLVVLSACNTGTGEVKTGEGVYGLRRAFVQAGTKGLVMSMWPVPDQETKELMVEFYTNLNHGLSPEQALRSAALQEMDVVRQRYGHTHPLYWAAFVYLGDPGRN